MPIKNTYTDHTHPTYPNRIEAIRMGLVWRLSLPDFHVLNEETEKFSLFVYPNPKEGWSFDWQEPEVEKAIRKITHA